MITRMLHVFILLAIPSIMLGGEPGRSGYVFRPDIPDTIKGIQIQFEVKQVKLLYQGKTVEIGGRQQRIILVDKCMKTEESPTDIKEYYSLVLLEYRQ